MYPSGGVPPQPSTRNNGKKELIYGEGHLVKIRVPVKASYRESYKLGVYGLGALQGSLKKIAFGGGSPRSNYNIIWGPCHKNSERAQKR